MSTTFHDIVAHWMGTRLAVRRRKALQPTVVRATDAGSEEAELERMSERGVLPVEACTLPKSSPQVQGYAAGVEGDALPFCFVSAGANEDNLHS